jgi:hypothetical protein
MRPWVPILLFAGLSVPCALVACDPELKIITRPGTDGGSEGGTKTEPSPTTGDAATTNLDGGDEEPKDDSGPGATATHVVDGNNDFGPNEKLATSSTNYDAYVAWDASFVYFGMSGQDVGSGSASRWVQVYLGVPGTTGTTTGISYCGQQQPNLPFQATHHLRWKASGDFSSVEIWQDGWKPASTTLIQLFTGKQGNFMEMSVKRSAIGANGKIAVHMNMLVECNSMDWTYAGAPSTSFTDGKNPSFGKYFEFDLADATKPPNAYAPK